MTKPLPTADSGELVAEVHLMPGEWYFGQHTIVKTLLGSCVAMTLWHPQLHVGGMCHYLLPSRKRTAHEALSGRYGNEAVELLIQSLRRCGTQPRDYVVQFFGGADLLHDPASVQSTAFKVGALNVDQAWTQARRFGFKVCHAELGENMARRISIDLQSGEVTVRRGTPHRHVNRAS